MKITDHDLYPFGLIHAYAGDRLRLFSGADEVMCHAVPRGAVGAIGTFYNLWGPACACARDATVAGRRRGGPRLHAPLPDRDRRRPRARAASGPSSARRCAKVRHRRRHASPARSEQPTRAWTDADVVADHRTGGWGTSCAP